MQGYIELLEKVTKLIDIDLLVCGSELKIEIEEYLKEQDKLYEFLDFHERDGSRF